MIERSWLVEPTVYEMCVQNLRMHRNSTWCLRSGLADSSANWLFEWVALLTHSRETLAREEGGMDMNLKPSVPNLGSASRFTVAAFAVSALLWAATASADSIEGQVLGAGAPIAKSTVTLWSASADAPKQLAQTQTADDGRFTLSAEASPDSILYIVAKGGEPAANKGGGDNPAIAFISVLGSKPLPKITINEMTTVASVWTNAQFLDGTALKGDALGLRSAAGNVPNFVDLETGGWGSAIQDSLNGPQTPTMANFATLADLLAGCVTRATADACDKLFVAATPPKGSAPANTLAAAESIARYPWYHPKELYSLLDSFYPIPQGKNLRPVPYMPYLNWVPSAWVLPLKFDGGGYRAAARAASTARATSGSATISRLAGRGRIRCGRATPPSSPPMANRFRRLAPALPVEGWKAARSALRSTPRTMPGSPPMAPRQSWYSTRAVSP